MAASWCAGRLLRLCRVRLVLGLGAVLAIGDGDFAWLLAPLNTAVDVIRGWCGSSA